MQREMHPLVAVVFARGAHPAPWPRAVVLCACRGGVEAVDAAVAGSSNGAAGSAAVAAARAANQASGAASSAKAKKR